jgi:2-haloalkanoic acid dehalogenase type II
MFSSVLVLVGLLTFASMFEVSAQTSDVCPSYDAKKIKLATFDCFAALMSFETSMLENIATIMPAWTSAQVDSVYDKWVSSYGAGIGRTFDESETGTFPFSWLISTELKRILDELGLSVTRSEFSALVASWGTLEPWTNTQSTLEKIHAAGITIGVLSNGDRYTLTRAVSTFVTVPFEHVFPTDFPVGAFKPVHYIYDATKEVGFDVDEILHVAGSDYDAGGARDAGLFSVLTHSSSRRGRMLGNSSSDGSSYTSPCFNVNDISEVLPVLGL